MKNEDVTRVRKHYKKHPVKHKRKYSRDVSKIKLKGGG